MAPLGWDENYGREPLFFHVPDEICIVTLDSREESPEGRHHRVREEHNTRLRQLVHGTNAPHEVIAPFEAPKGLHADLAPAQETLDFLRAKVQSNRDILTPLDTPHARRPHWVDLPNSRDPNTTRRRGSTLHYYRVGDDGDRNRPVAERARRVRDLVLLLNLHARRTGAPARAVPNWIAAAAGQTCPSPGSAPVWVLPGKVHDGEGYWSFTFPHKQLAEIVQRGRENASDIVIAVLDTSPTAPAVRAAADDPRHANNLLLRRVAADTNVTIDAQLPQPLPSLPHLDGVRTNWRDQAMNDEGPLPEPSFQMDDHGLFITGIIHDIAPQAQIRLIRVLNGFGVTDHHAAIAALAQLPQLLETNRQRLIVNLSLGFAIPPGIEVLRWWMTETYRRLVAEPGFAANPTIDSALERLAKDDPETHAELRAILDDMHAGLQEIIDWLKTHPRILIVAAAGNDNGFFGERGVRPEPRWPARYDKVLGVAAVGQESPADYSNRGDVAIIGNGIATYGGNATREDAGDLGTIDTTVPHVDAIAGIYSSDTLTVGAGTNETGWVYWSGTSFATPIITGLAADLWDARLAERGDDAAPPRYGPQELIHELVNTFYSEPRDDADPNTLGTPTIEAEQEWAKAWKGRP